MDWWPTTSARRWTPKYHDSSGCFSLTPGLKALSWSLLPAIALTPSQLTIFNAKWRGERPVLDDADRPLSRELYSDEQWLHRILRFSALPGTSRHHWGTDLDVFDPTLLPEDQKLALTPSEYGDSGYFSALTQWLDQAIASGQSRGFERPYDADRGGVSIEPWHLSYLPRATQLRGHQSPEALRELWDQSPHLRPEGFELLSQCLDEIFDRYVL